jgi:hypothetical protein
MPALRIALKAWAIGSPATMLTVTMAESGP